MSVKTEPGLQTYLRKQESPGPAGGFLFYCVKYISMPSAMPAAIFLWYPSVAMR